MAKNKFYVVFIGKQIGIFNTWDECKLNTNGFKGSKFKSYPTLNEAKTALNDFNNSLKNPNKNNIKKTPNIPTINYHSISVDGACSGNPGKGEYKCVDTKTEETIFSSNLFLQTTNNIMEFFALVEGILWLKNNNSNKFIYSDSKTAIAWVRNKKTKTTLKRTNDNTDTFLLIEKYENILSSIDIDMNIILKWDTAKLGEIKADFGRK